MSLCDTMCVYVCECVRVRVLACLHVQRMSVCVCVFPGVSAEAPFGEPCGTLGNATGGLWVDCRVFAQRVPKGPRGGV